MSQSAPFCDIILALKRRPRVTPAAIRSALEALRKNALALRARSAAETLARWPGQHLSLVVDGHEFLSAMLYEDELGLHNAIWSRSTYLSSLQHNGIGLELSYTRLTSEVKAGASLEDLHRSILDLEQFYLSNCTDALDLLHQELGVSS